jgi:hypothetical protein
MVLRAVVEKKGLQELADEYGVSYQRAHQIVSHGLREIAFYENLAWARRNPEEVRRRVLIKDSRMHPVEMAETPEEFYMELAHEKRRIT